MDVRIQAETSEELWESLPEEYKERFEIKRIDVIKIKGEPAKEVYKKDPRWCACHEVMVNAIKARTEREEQIRTDLR